MKKLNIIFLLVLFSCTSNRENIDSEIRGFLSPKKLLKSETEIIVRKIDSINNWYIIQIENNKHREVLISDMGCKKNIKYRYKLEVNKSCKLRLIEDETYGNIDNYIDTIKLNDLTERNIYLSDQLCGLFYK